MLRKEILTGGLEAIHAAAQVNLVAVEREDLLLGEGALDLDGEICLLNLAPRGAVGAEEKIASQLHGQRRRALRAAVAADVVERGAGHAEDVDAPVRLEIFIFDRNYSLAQHRCEAVVSDDLAPLKRECADQPAVAVVEIGDSGGTEVFQLIDLRQVD